jgi:ABC-type phosphate/phosphonate transport system substrate-binding protein
MKELPGHGSGNNRAAATPPLPNARLTLACILVAVVLLARVSHAGANPEEALPKVLHVAFSSRVFPDVDHRDVRIAMELWARELSRKAGIPQARVTLFTSPGEIEGMVRRGDIHLVTLPPLDYLAWRHELTITPAYVAANKSGGKMEYLLVVRGDSGLTTVRDLRGKTLALPPVAKDRTSSLWLSVLLLREGLRNADGFFGKQAETAKPSQAILGVFFRQYHAAIVNRGSLETCIAVNPQLSRDLKVLAASRSLIGEITCLPVTVGKKLREAMDAAALTLHETPVGRQMTTLFHIDRVVLFTPSYLAGLEDLLRERDRLMNSRSKKR